MKIYKISQNFNVASVVYHNTSVSNLESILENGLLINKDYNKSQKSQDFIKDIYGLNPIFVSLDPNKFKEENDVTLKINTSGIDLVADIPSLYVEAGGYYNNEMRWMYFEDSPESLKQYLKEDNVALYEDLLFPHDPLTNECIKLTRSAAVMENIKPEYIEKLDNT